MVNVMQVNKSLLESLSSSEVDDLIFEEELIRDGFLFHYFIDQVDLEKYVLPFGLIEGEKFDQREKRPVEVITDEQIAYDFLFNIRDEKLLIFDEHTEELEGLKRKINKVKLYGINTIDSFKIQSKYFLEVRDGKPISFQEWQNNQKLTSELSVSLLISIALGSLRSSIENLNKIQSEKVITKIEEYITLKFKTAEIVFEKCKPDEVTDRLFEALTDSYSEHLQRRIAKYQKCKVFNRTICINKKSLELKEIFLLLSSAKSLNERLPIIAKQLGYGIEVKDKILNPIRTIGQIYLQILLKDRDKISELKKIRKIIQIRESTESAQLKEAINHAITNYFEKEIINSREGYENVSLLLKIDNYRELFAQALEKKKIKNQDVINQSILELLKIAEEKKELERLRSTNLLKLEHQRTYQQTLNAALREVAIGHNYLFAFSGLDHIENSYHTIPLVFSHGSDKFIEILEKIIDLATESSKVSFNSKILIMSINQSFDLLFHKVLPNEEEKIIMLIILMMVGRKPEYNPDNLAYNWVNDILDKKEYDEKWTNDFIYIKSWICRRLKNYNEAISVAEGITDPINPARFYHSLFLSYYCLFTDTNNIEFLNKSLYNCKLAYDNYISYKDENKIYSITYSAVSNSIAYLNTLLFVNSEKRSEILLQNARKYLILLREREKFNYYKFPEFLHTEAFLEVQEYKLDNNPNKLHYALSTIEKAIKLKPKEAYLNLKKEINQMLTGV